MSQLVEEAVEISGVATQEVKKLLLHSSHYLVGMVGGLIVGLVSFPIFTRVFTVAEYGVLDLAQRVILLLTIASKAGLQNAVLRFYDKDNFAANPQSARSYYSTMYLGVLITAVAVAAVYLAVTAIRPSVLMSGLSRLGFLVLALALLRSLGAILWGFLRIEERTKIFNATQVGTRAATVATICALLPLAGHTAQTYFTGTALVEMVLAATLSVALIRRRLLDPSSFNMHLFRSGVAFGLPLVVYELAFAVLGSADRFLVRHYLGAESLGFYSVAYGIAQHANDLLVSPLILAILPIYMGIWTSSGAQKTIEFLTISLDLFLMVGMCVLAVTMAAARPLVLLLASSKYAGVDRFIPIILAGLLIYATYIFFAAGLLIQKKTLTMAGLLIIAAAMNIALNCMLLSPMGLYGSAWATLLSYSACILLLARVSHRFLPLQVHFAALARYACAASAAALAGACVVAGSAVADIALKASLTVFVYIACLCAVDLRVRRFGLRALRACRAAI